ncbi:UNVERIFIED_CONTAM: hypothetical protein RMT77_006587 [Armadillidium vulgare]
MMLRSLNKVFGNILPSFSIILVLHLSTICLVVNPSVAEINPPTTNVVKPEYDFIIVGAGAAGAVLANRLSEVSNFDVLLLEAGGNATERSEIPFFLTSLWRTELDWNYTLGPSSQYCLGMKDKTCFYPRGRGLGGSSTVNHMMYVRGNKKDFDDWAEAGNQGWSYEDLLPYFKKSEDNQNNIYATDNVYHSNEGELTISDIRWTTPLADLFLKAGEELGYATGDCNADNQTVFASPQLSTRNGTRCSTNKAFLVPAGNRKNLDIVVHAHVTKVLINPETNHAFGVRYFRNGDYYDVKARKEIILSAGAANTPQLLMLSGVGPKDHIQELNIPLIKDLPVGLNLRDHVALGLTFLTDSPVTFRGDRYLREANMTYNIYKKGPYTSTLEEAIGFLNSKLQDPKEGRPDLQFYIIPNSAASDGGSSKIVQNLGDQLYEAKYEPIEDSESFTIVINLLRPKSVGRTFLRSNDPFEKPVLNVNYFDEEEDIKKLIDGARIALKLMETKTFKKLNVSPHLPPLPLCPKAPL